jgi:hypothetical protein
MKPSTKGTGWLEILEIMVTALLTTSNSKGPGVCKRGGCGNTGGEFADVGYFRGHLPMRPPVNQALAGQGSLERGGIEEMALRLFRKPNKAEAANIRPIGSSD